jgi:hypothetical protein
MTQQEETEVLDQAADNVGDMLLILDLSRMHGLSNRGHVELWDHQMEVTKEILNELTLLKQEVESLKAQMEKFNPIGGQ